MADESSEASDHSESSQELDNQSKEEAPVTETTEPKPKSSQPKSSIMVVEAIEHFTVEQGAMSLKAIKKFITEKYGPISETQSRNIRKYLKQAVSEGSLVQPKGKEGINGSFKKPSAANLAAQRKAAKAAKAAESAEAADTKQTSKQTSSTSKKQASSKAKPKASTADQKSKTTKATKASAKTTPKSPMAKKTAKSPTSKPKAPKPKKVTAATKSPKPAAKRTVAAKQ